MRRGLRIEDLGDLLELPLLAVLATRRRDGNVLLSPVWHEWRDGGFNIVTSDEGVKAQHLRRDPRASVVVCEHTPPYRGIELRGGARLVRDDAAAVVRRLAIRFLGAAEGAVYAEGSGDDTVIRLEPGDLRAWDFADEF